jgi:OmpA-OmpF porin, OOP family
MPQLAAVAEALRSAPQARRVIVGHTDTIGSDAYNAKLSFARAEATRDMLIKRFGVPASQLAAMGAGKAQPLPGVPGEAAVNRRVEFSVR